MSESTISLQLVMLFDPRKHTFCICSHNLSAEDASQEVAELRRDGLPAFTVDQRTRHTELDAEKCSICRADVQQYVKPLSGYQHTR
jgi:hypothetical protein